MQSSVGGFTVSQMIGAGGFSAVYRARQKRFDRDVALKILSIRIGDEMAAQHFENECLALGRLDAHPNIADVHDAGVAPDGRPYIAMRLYRRGSLADLLARRGPLPLDGVLAVGVAISRALQAAHNLGILHRDVKPQNILITDRGDFVLSDFGVSAVESGIAWSHIPAFTYAHAAPEVMDSQPTGMASDQYSLASTLFTLATGVVPFPDRATDFCRPEGAVSEVDLSDPRVAAIAPVLGRALSVDPRDRYPSMNDFAEGLIASGEDFGVDTAALQSEVDAGRDEQSGSARLGADSFRVIREGSAISTWISRIVESGHLTARRVSVVFVAVLLLTTALKWMMFAFDHVAASSETEWLSFRNLLFVAVGVVAAVMMNTRGSLRSVGFGIAFFVIASRFKITASWLLGAAHGSGLALTAWVLLLTVIVVVMLMVAISAFRYQVWRQPTRLAGWAVGLLIVTAVSWSVYTFWSWAPMVKNVGDFSLLGLVTILGGAVTIISVLLAARVDAIYGVLGYAAAFAALHSVVLLGMVFGLNAGEPRLGYELPLLGIVVLALGFSLFAIVGLRRSRMTENSLEVAMQTAVRQTVFESRAAGE